MSACTVSGTASPSTCAAFDEHPRELLCVERISTDALEERALRLCGKERALEKGLEESAGLLDRQRREGDRRRVPLSSAPSRLTLEELGARGAEEEKRHGHVPVQEVLEELEKRAVSPMEVLDDEDTSDAERRPPRGSDAMR